MSSVSLSGPTLGSETINPEPSDELGSMSVSPQAGGCDPALANEFCPHATHHR
ncbi:MAG TPA: hypothetical protein VID48_03210 [Solirubrobacteraceae bacterium]